MIRIFLLCLCVSFFSFSLLSGTEEDVFLSTNKMFTSETSRIEEEDGLGHRMIYSYLPADYWKESEGKQILSLIESYDGESLSCTERFFWEASIVGKPLLMVRAIEDGQGSVYLASRYFYDAEGKLIKKNSYGNISGDNEIPLILGSNGYPLENGVNSLETFYIYSGDGEDAVLLNALDDRGHVTSYFYDTDDQLIGVSQYEDDNQIPEQGAIYSLMDMASNFCTSIRTYLWDREEIEARFDRAVHQTLGGFFLTMSGWHVFSPEAGVYGVGEINDKVRITMINGILNRPETCQENLELISGAHADANLHYIFRPTEGWTWDLIKSMFVKFGYVSESSRLLAKVWRELIQEMGGVNGGGIIIHYAHSVGGTETYTASSLLTPEERQMIRIITIGSASMIPSSLGHESVVNYVSVRDGVSLLDTQGYIMGLLSSESNVVYLGSFFGVPLIDHLMTMDTYRHLIERLGQQVLEEHGHPMSG